MLQNYLYIVGIIFSLFISTPYACGNGNLLIYHLQSIPLIIVVNHLGNLRNYGFGIDETPIPKDFYFWIHNIFPKVIFHSF